mmetsp:Transcript_23942/g.38476  ORF Transcript_23942/g.38476 Transcript_23942/m.38476 type:complete len:227 (-) Transcript_23942:7-687(-)
MQMHKINIIFNLSTGDMIPRKVKTNGRRLRMLFTILIRIRDRRLWIQITLHGSLHINIFIALLRMRMFTIETPFLLWRCMDANLVHFLNHQWCWRHTRPAILIMILVGCVCTIHNTPIHRRQTSQRRVHRVQTQHILVIIRFVAMSFAQHTALLDQHRVIVTQSKRLRTTRWIVRLAITTLLVAVVVGAHHFAARHTLPSNAKHVDIAGDQLLTHTVESTRIVAKH